MDNIPTPVLTTDQPIQQPTSSSSNPIPQFIPESKPKTVIRRILSFIKRIAWFGGIVFFIFIYYTNFKICQETGYVHYDIMDGGVTIPCTFSNQLSTPLYATGIAILGIAVFFLPLNILFVVFLFKSKNQKAYLLNTFFIINAVLFILAIQQIPLLIRQALYPLKVNHLLPSYLPAEIVRGPEFSKNYYHTEVYYYCAPIQEKKSPIQKEKYGLTELTYTPKIEISQTNLSNAEIFNIDQYEKNETKYDPPSMNERISLTNTEGLYLPYIRGETVERLVFFTKDSRLIITTYLGNDCLNNSKSELIKMANSMLSQ